MSPTGAAARGEQPSGDEEESGWPFGVSRTPTMTIGSALSILQREFPAVRVSKIRFLEDQGLVSPHRTPSGYRTYSQADVERLRFCLAAQRDSFLPWKVVRERLAELDAGGPDVPAPGARVVTEDGDLVTTETPSRLTADQVAERAGCDAPTVDALTRGGLLSTDAGGKYPPVAVEIAALAGQLAEHGIDHRHLRTVRNAADRQVDLIEQIVAPVRSQRSGPSASGARARSHALASELAKTFTALHTALLRSAVDRLE